MPTVAIATYQRNPEITDDDWLAVSLLRHRGVDVQAVVWDAPNVVWTSFDCVVIRSTWDYHLKPGQFADWLRAFSAADNRLWNPAAAVLDNLNKRYLLDLAARGIDVVPTVYQPASAEVELTDILAGCSWRDVVIKPAISASAWGTWRTSCGPALEDVDRFSRQCQLHDMLVQPYMPEIAESGEWSLVFIGGRYSHATLKKPRPGEFRVQQHLGGTTDRAEPKSHVIHTAERILAMIGHSLLYARIDGFECKGRFVLMELEIIEPFLLLGYSATAAARLADAIAERL